MKDQLSKGFNIMASLLGGKHTAPANDSHELEVPAVTVNPRANDGDGVTHINLSINGETKLGRQLAHFSDVGFVHPHFGPFNGMEGFWHYINSVERDDELRHLIGHAAKKYSKQLTKVKVVGFQEIITVANFYRIEQNPELQKMFLDSTLPFDDYYYHDNGPVAIRPKGHGWVVNMFEEIRTMMKQGKRPADLDYTKVGHQSIG
jgi:hypothetical protein